MEFQDVPSILFYNIFLADGRIKIMKCVIGPGLCRLDDVF